MDDGRKKLAEVIRRDGSQASVAAEVGCSQGHLSLVLDGKRWASPQLAKKLSQAVANAVPPDELVSPKTREVADLLRAG